MDKNDIKTIAGVSIIVVILTLVVIGVNAHNSSLPPVQVDYANGDVYRLEQPSIDYEVQFYSIGDMDEIDMGIRLYNKEKFVDVASLSGVWNQLEYGGKGYCLKKTGKLEIRRNFFIDNSYPDNIEVMFWITSENYETSKVLDLNLKV